MTSTSPQSAAIPRPPDEEQRLTALHRHQLLDTPAGDDFDVLTELAAHVCETPYAFVSLVDRDRVWSKSQFGAMAPATARDDCCSWTILEDEFLAIPDLAKDERTANTPSAAGVRMFTGVNLKTADGFRIGTLGVFDDRPRILNAWQLRLLAGISRQVMALIELRTQQRILAATLAGMERMATIDDLTGLWHRRVLLERLDIEVERARRFGSPLSVLLLDVDQFKRINEGHGHAMGDVVLRNIGGIVRDELRQVDFAGRYGGEEFCILLPGTPLAGGLTLAEALREEVELFVHALGEHSLTATASFGLASLEPGDDVDATSLLRAADDALLRAKSLGRNRVESSMTTENLDAR